MDFARDSLDLVKNIFFNFRFLDVIQYSLFSRLGFDIFDNVQSFIFNGNQNNMILW